MSGSPADKNGHVEVKAGNAVDAVRAEQGEKQAQPGGSDALEHVAARNGADQQQANGSENEDFPGAELEHEFSEDGHAQQHHEAAEAAAAERGDVGEQQSFPRMSSLSQGIPVKGCDYGGGGAGSVDENG